MTTVSDPVLPPRQVASLFRNALKAGSSASKYPTLDPTAQASTKLVSTSIVHFRRLLARIRELNLFSLNETLEDVSTRDLLYMLAPFAYAEILGQMNAREVSKRKDIVLNSETQLRNFIKLVEGYEGIIPPDEANLSKKSGAFAITDPFKRREVKIKQWQQEKEIKSKIELSHSADTPQDDEAGNYEEPYEEDGVRETTLLLIRLFYGQAHTQLEQLEMEAQLLKSAPSDEELGGEDEEGEGSGEDDRRRKRNEEEDETWKLDPPVARGGPDGRGPLLDAQGKPLRPFTIVSSSSQAVDRASLQEKVFRADHRLPTMTIDEYLAEEARRGNIISGGGQASAEKPTTTEQLEIDSEQDGTIFGDEKSEEKRKKDEEWALYTEEHAKGSGNTMNRG
ncbi:TAP42-like protein [Cantharellus anzutake]|uniref:TAP42-like protein n=1 Tax=Cantharellus anzutake TaxID=1750568 RepID=UPI001906F9CC|nr:TAP42-like protein [Cantharellus anzutake]KAF8343969.1 TAP42-like protein [Cantharellus anzutake]